MSYKVHPKELQAVSAMPAQDRYDYFLRKLADWEQVWSVGDGAGWSLMKADDRTELVPVWPAEAFASACCVGIWDGRKAKPISLSDWLEKWTPGMVRDKRRVAVFPLPTARGVVVAPERLLDDIQKTLADYE